MVEIRNIEENATHEIEAVPTRQKHDGLYDRVHAAFETAEPIFLHNSDLDSTGVAFGERSVSESIGCDNSGLSVEAANLPGGLVDHALCANQHDQSPEDLEAFSPIVPLGHKNGNYFFITASGELRCIKAEALEAGRGVRALFSGVSQKAESWCRSNFPTAANDCAHRDVVLWIIKSCNAAGVFEPSNADLRSIGVWRVKDGTAVAHCGNSIVYPNGQIFALSDYKVGHIMIGAAPIAPPATTSTDCR